MAYKKLKFWFDKELAILLSDKINTVVTDFNATAFIHEADEQVPSLELKDRVKVLADSLHKNLYTDYLKNINVLLQILGEPNPNETGMFTEYYWLMPVAQYVESYGLDHVDVSFKAIEAITQRNTGEYTIRPFILKHYEKTMMQMLAWSEHENFHVRRLSSEGVRPRLPWASKLDKFIADPTPILPILENLKDDPSKYVQNSVANNLNDILKDNRSVFTATIEAWITSATPQRKWIIKHAIRKLRKAQDPWALHIMSAL
jgi:3-methyladenine DNA glycosylase AlkC